MPDRGTQQFRMHISPPPNIDIFRPSWGRWLFALILAVAGFLFPQEVPLEWYPLNEPGTDINYFEISCAADKTGEVKIYYNLTRGLNELNSIRFPISPTEQTYTYTFPLPDGPITELHVDPPAQGGTLNIRQMRIINRRNEEIRRFTRDMFQAEREIAAITPSSEGWKLTSIPTATNPSTRIDLRSPIIPVGKDHRNLLRCLLSTGYLTMMLWILLLAVLFTFYRPTSWRDGLAHLGFMACLAFFFAIVGNRGLIRNSVHYAGFIVPPIAPGFSLEFDVLTSNPAMAQLFFDTGDGFNEKESVRLNYEPHQGLQTLRYPLPNKSLKALRFDPCESETQLEIRGIRVVDAGQNTRALLPLESLKPESQIAEARLEKESLHLQTAPQANDPIMHFSSTAVAAINQSFPPDKSINPQCRDSHYQAKRPQPL